MRQPGVFMLSLLFAVPCAAQPRTRANLSDILGFENGAAGHKPVGWAAPANAVVDDQVAHGGKFSARITRAEDNANPFTSMTLMLPVDFAGSKLEWRGFIKTEEVREYVALWLRVDGDNSQLAFATLQRQKIDGTRDWKEYSISVDLPADGKQVVFGFLLAGTGKAWVDDLRLLVDGKPVAEAKAKEIPVTVLDKDQTFDGGSRFSPDAISALQVKNLATLGRIWGFLKYHHPAVTGGTRHWDYDLFRVLPAVLAAKDREAANAAILEWIRGLGKVAACAPCASLPRSGLSLSPDIAFIHQVEILGPELSRELGSIHENRNANPSHFYLSMVPGVGNPKFEHELPYRNIKFPDAGYQLLALFRQWNMVHYFYPARDVMTDDPEKAATYWHDVLEEFIPRVALARDKTAFQLELMQFIARIHDSHANLWSSLDVRPPVGACHLPVAIRFVEGKPIVVREGDGLLPGDIVTELDGVAVDGLIARQKPFYAASNEAVRLRDIGDAMTRGDCGPAKVTVLRDAKSVAVATERKKRTNAELLEARAHDRPGPAFQKLTPEVAYLKLSAVSSEEAATYVRNAAGTRGWIIDIRNYPSQFMVFALGSLLYSEKKDFVQFTHVDAANPGATLRGVKLSITPAEPHYAGKVVILVDEKSVSQSEYTAMAFRAAPGAVVIGSTTAGADGNVSQIPLPGGLSSAISGLGVFYPDQTPTQRVGIVPDIRVTPTIAGIRAGRDEVIEAAIREIMR